VFFSGHKNGNDHADSQQVRIEKERNDLHTGDLADPGRDQKLGAIRDNALGDAGTGIQQGRGLFGFNMIFL
jgi:hypothetical protein